MDRAKFLMPPKSARLIAEENLERMLAAYLQDHKQQFAFGGLTNLMYTLEKMCRELAEDYEDYDEAAEVFAELQKRLDKSYRRKEEEPWVEEAHRREVE